MAKKRSTPRSTQKRPSKRPAPKKRVKVHVDVQPAPAEPPKLPSIGKVSAPPADWPKKFLLALAGTGNVSEAARIAGVDRTTPYARRKEDVAFSGQWDEAIEIAIDLLELEARRRAYDGVPEPSFYQGAVCGYTQKYSDQLLTFLLRAHRPDKYRENVKVDMPALEVVLGQLPTGIAETVRGLLASAVQAGGSEAGVPAGRPSLPG